jgi:hypothetical protein
MRDQMSASLIAPRWFARPILLPPGGSRRDPAARVLLGVAVGDLGRPAHDLRVLTRLGHCRHVLGLERPKRDDAVGEIRLGRT